MLKFQPQRTDHPSDRDNTITVSMLSQVPSSPATERVGPFQFAILLLSVLALAVIAADTIFTLPPEISRILQGVDLVVCCAFLIDFVLRFRAAGSKAQFMKFGWIDLVASIPMIDALRFGRFVRILRIIRLLRGIRSFQRLLAMLFTDRFQGGAISVLLTTFLLVVFSSIGVLLFENDPNSNIRTAGDALWWSVTTITTVGYGDCYPVTAGGRILAMGLMIAGVGLFGTLSGIIAAMFLGKSDQESARRDELRTLRAEVERQRVNKVS